MPRRTVRWSPETDEFWGGVVTARWAGRLTETRYNRLRQWARDTEERLAVGFESWGAPTAHLWGLTTSPTERQHSEIVIGRTLDVVADWDETENRVTITAVTAAPPIG